MQHTLKHAVTIEGIGLHSGCQTKLTLNPAPINSGIVFCRSDMAGKPTVPALYSNVVDTRNCTCLSSSQGAVVSTIEHLMAALYILGIDNALIVDPKQRLSAKQLLQFNIFKTCPMYPKDLSRSFVGPLSNSLKYNQAARPSTTFHRRKPHLVIPKRTKPVNPINLTIFG